MTFNLDFIFLLNLIVNWKIIVNLNLHSGNPTSDRANSRDLWRAKKRAI